MLPSCRPCRSCRATSPNRGKSFAAISSRACLRITPSVGFLPSLMIDPTTLSAESVLRPDAPPLRHRHYFRRESLHEIVWTAPVTEVAKHLGVSDVGLAKLCRRAAIPTPARGYWARVESGQHVGSAALPPAPAGYRTCSESVGQSRWQARRRQRSPRQ